MPAKKNGLSLDEHREIGDLLKRTRGELLTVDVKLLNSYPRGSAESLCLSSAVAALDNAKNLLDEAVFAEYPEHAEPSIYYGPHEATTKED